MAEDRLILEQLQAQYWPCFAVSFTYVFELRDKSGNLVTVGTQLREKVEAILYPKLRYLNPLFASLSVKAGTPSIKEYNIDDLTMLPNWTMVI